MIGFPAVPTTQTPNLYCPPPHGSEWEWVNPERAGFDQHRLDEALAFAREHETPSPRGAPNGLLLRRGRIVGAWGDTRQVDMTFSIAKSYLSLLAGIAWADGL